MATPARTRSQTQSQGEGSQQNSPVALTSKTMDAPPPPKPQNSLKQFHYKDENFPAESPWVDDNSSKLEVTISLVDDILAPGKFDVAKRFLIDNKKCFRLFEPRQIYINGKLAPAPYKIENQEQANAMTWFLFDEGIKMEKCSSCASLQSKGPFTECIVPKNERANGACTNCLFMGHGSRCVHRADPKTPSKKNKYSTVPFTGFKPADIQNATDQQIQRWTARIQVEMAKREKESGANTPGGNKRAK